MDINTNIRNFFFIESIPNTIRSINIKISSSNILFLLIEGVKIKPLFFKEKSPKTLVNVNWPNNLPLKINPHKLLILWTSSLLFKHLCSVVKGLYF